MMLSVCPTLPGMLVFDPAARGWRSPVSIPCGALTVRHIYTSGLVSPLHNAAVRAPHAGYHKLNLSHVKIVIHGGQDVKSKAVMYLLAANNNRCPPPRTHTRARAHTHTHTRTHTRAHTHMPCSGQKRPCGLSVAPSACGVVGLRGFAATRAGRTCGSGGTWWRPAGRAAAASFPPNDEVLCSRSLILMCAIA